MESMLSSIVLIAADRHDMHVRIHLQMHKQAGNISEPPLNQASTISGLVPKPPGTDSVNPITTPAEGSPWEGDLWKVQEDEANEDSPSEKNL